MPLFWKTGYWFQSVSVWMIASIHYFFYFRLYQLALRLLTLMSALKQSRCFYCRSVKIGERLTFFHRCLHWRRWGHCVGVKWFLPRDPERAPHITWLNQLSSENYELKLDGYFIDCKSRLQFSPNYIFAVAYILFFYLFNYISQSSGAFC